MSAEKTCQICGNKFTDNTKNGSRKTCSPKCRRILRYSDPEDNFNMKVELRVNTFRNKGVIFDEFTIQKIKNDLRVGRCQLCGSKIPDFRKRHIDHDHATGIYRGILCNRCNSGIGFLQDNPVLAERMVEYLKTADSRLERNEQIRS